MSSTEHSFLSVIRFALGVAAAVLLFIAGHDMRGLNSQLGGTVAEVFDHALGLMCYGLGLAALMIAIPTTFVQQLRERDDDPSEFVLDADDDNDGGESP